MSRETASNSQGLDTETLSNLIDVYITCHIQSVTITLRFRYSALPNPVKTLYSTFLLLDVSVLPFLLNK